MAIFQNNATTDAAAGIDDKIPVKRRGRFAPISVELLALLSSLFFSVFSNRLLWSAVQANHGVQGHSWGFLAAVFLIVTALHFTFLLVVLNRWTFKPILATLFMVTALVTYYMNRYTVFFDTSMMRNVLHTDIKEARDLLTPMLALHMLLHAGLPILILSRVRLHGRRWPRAVLIRAACLLAGLAVTMVCTMLVFQELSALMRNHKEVRYLVTPSNYLVSLYRAVAADTVMAQAPRIPIGKDAALAASWARRDKPVLFVVVVGETARAANWGLNGYARQTTPELTELGVVNFNRAVSCGTNTEVSVPCMFSPFGRRQYDEKKIRGHESLLHVLEHAGLKTLWRDNQSGCKGVCDGLEQQRLDAGQDPNLCDGEGCLDEILLKNLGAELGKSKKSMVVVLHQLGNHGPAYYRRYPTAFRRFTPTCETSELGSCSREEIVNSFDNALLYTDHFLAQTIRTLQAQKAYDTAMIYVSDHGESLGENGIYLHGMPYSIAPKEQTEVPMVAWLSPGFAANFGIDQACLRTQATLPVSHDHLFHSILGMLQVTTKEYEKAFDFSATCSDGQTTAPELEAGMKAQRRLHPRRFSTG